MFIKEKIMDIIEDEKVTNKLVSRLRTYIDSFEKNGIPFEKIFNNDKIKYDCYGKGFYCFKMHLDHHKTYRMLYRFIRNIKDYVIEPHLTILKRDTGKGHGKRDYIDCFEKYVKEAPCIK